MANKPHIYKVNGRWYCKVKHGGRTILGIGQPDPLNAYLSFFITARHIKKYGLRRFKIKSLVTGMITHYTELDAPDWLTGRNTVRGSTMDNRWFWRNYVLTLKVGKSVETDFNKITRIE